MLCVGLALQFAFGGWNGLAEAVLGALVGLAVLLPFHMVRAMGAGDVKLLAALGSLLGPKWTLIAAVYTLLGGALLALGYLAVGSLRAMAVPAAEPAASTWSWRPRLLMARERMREMRRERFPYALAVVVGALLAVIQRGDLRLVLDYLGSSGR